MSRIYSRISSFVLGSFVCLALSACAVSPQASSPTAFPPSPSSAPTGQEGDESLPLEGDSPRALASLHLTEQARMLLESGKIDDAITTLERAVILHPSNGRNYYYLAEAWLKKENPSQAGEFNRLAEMYLRDDPEWINRVRDQKERIGTR